MRIIAGEFRRRLLIGPSAADVDGANGAGRAALRPTADRVREALFAHLLSGQYGANGAPISHAHILDLFAGTGALGLEALSRGAAFAHFVEAHTACADIIAQNIKNLNVRHKTRLHCMDATIIPPALSAPHKPASLVFLDPPYALSPDPEIVQRFYQKGWIARDALIIWESAAPLMPTAALKLITQRRYGKSHISIFRRHDAP